MASSASPVVRAFAKYQFETFGVDAIFLLDLWTPWSRICLYSRSSLGPDIGGVNSVAGPTPVGARTRVDLPKPPRIEVIGLPLIQVLCLMRRGKCGLRHPPTVRQ